MKTYYKIFLIIFVIFTAINIYAIDWSVGFMHSQNSTYVFSIAAAILGVLLVFVLNTWSKLSLKK